MSRDHLDRWAAVRRAERPRERPQHLDIEEANRRDARAAAEFASPPATRATAPVAHEPAREDHAE